MKIDGNEVGPVQAETVIRGKAYTKVLLRSSFVVFQRSPDGSVFLVSGSTIQPKAVRSGDLRECINEVYASQSHATRSHGIDARQS